MDSHFIFLVLGDTNWNFSLHCLYIVHVLMMLNTGRQMFFAETYTVG